MMDALKCRPIICVICQGPQFCLSASRSLRRLIPKSKSRENAVYRCKAIVVNKPHRKNTLYQKVLASTYIYISVYTPGTTLLCTQYYPFTVNTNIPSVECDLVPQSATTTFCLGFCIYPYSMTEADTHVKVISNFPRSAGQESWNGGTYTVLYT